MDLFSESSLRKVASTAEVAGLGAFLRSRCGNLKSAFNALDEHSAGHLTFDNFAKGLNRLGHVEDCGHIFRAIDTNHVGLISLRAFLVALEDRGMDGACPSRISIGSADPRPSTALNIGSLASVSAKSKDRPTSSHNTHFVVNATTSAQMQRQPTSGKPLSSSRGAAEFLLPSSGALRDDGESSVTSHSASEGPTSSVDGEQKLMRRVMNLIGVSIAEHVDTLRVQVMEERTQRQTEVAKVTESVAAFKTELTDSQEEALSLAQALARNVAEGTAAEIAAQADEERRKTDEEQIAALQSSMRQEVSRAVEGMQGQLQELLSERGSSAKHIGSEDIDSKLDTKIGAKLGALMAEVMAGLAAERERGKETEQHVTKMLAASDVAAAGVAQEVSVLRQSLSEEHAQRAAEFAALRAGLEAEREERRGLDRTVAVLRDQPPTSSVGGAALEQRLDESHRAVLSDAASALAAADRAAAIAEHSRLATDQLSAQLSELTARLPKAMVPSLAQLEALMSERLEHARGEWCAAIEDERARGTERTQDFTRALAQEFERTTVAQAVAEARAEAITLLSGRLEDGQRDTQRQQQASDAHAERLANMEGRLGEFELNVVSRAVAEARAEASNAVCGELEALRRQVGTSRTEASQHAGLIASLDTRLASLEVVSAPTNVITDTESTAASSEADASAMQRLGEQVKQLDCKVDGLCNSTARRGDSSQLFSKLQDEANVFRERLQNVVGNEVPAIQQHLQQLHGATELLRSQLESVQTEHTQVWHREAKIRAEEDQRIEELCGHLCTERVAVVSSEVKATALSLEDFRRSVRSQGNERDAKIKALSATLQDRIQELISKLDDKCTQGLGPTVQQLGAFAEAAAAASAAARSPSLPRTPCETYFGGLRSLESSMETCHAEPGQVGLSGGRSFGSARACPGAWAPDEPQTERPRTPPREASATTRNDNQSPASSISWNRRSNPPVVGVSRQSPSFGPGLQCTGPLDGRHSSPLGSSRGLQSDVDRQASAPSRHLVAGVQIPAPNNASVSSALSQSSGGRSDAAGGGSMSLLQRPLLESIGSSGVPVLPAETFPAAADPLSLSTSVQPEVLNAIQALRSEVMRLHESDRETTREAISVIRSISPTRDRRSDGMPDDLAWPLSGGATGHNTPNLKGQLWAGATQPSLSLQQRSPQGLGPPPAQIMTPQSLHKATAPINPAAPALAGGGALGLPGRPCIAGSPSFTTRGSPDWRHSAPGR